MQQRQGNLFPLPRELAAFLAPGLALLVAAPLAIIVAITSLLATPTPAAARWKPQYAALPQPVRDWYATRELTAAAQARFNFKSCCARSDVVKTRFKVSGAGADEWFWLDGARWRRVPADIIHWNEHAPGGGAVLFALGSEPTCFFPPESGN